MIALLCFILTVLISPFKSKSRLEAENAALRHQLIVLRRKLRGRVRLTNSDRFKRIGGDAVGGNSSGRNFEAERLHRLLDRNWIGSGESIFNSLVQRLFAAFTLGLIANLRFELLRFSL